MDTLTNLIEEHEVGDWCKRAAWVLAGLGLLNFFLDFYALFSQNNPFNSSNTSMLPSLVAQIFRILLGSISNTLFFFFVLYAAGTVLNHLIAKPEEEDEEEEDE